MPRVPITLMGFRCSQCSHEWLPRVPDHAPETCPQCESAEWDGPLKPENPLTYEDFRDKIRDSLKDGSLTWTEIRTMAKLPQKFPNNKWVHRLELDIGLQRCKDSHGIFRWKIG